MLLVTHVPGHVPDRTTLDVDQSHISGVRIVVEPAPAAGRATFRLGGQLLVRWHLVLTDVTEKRAQTSCELQLDEKGSTSTEWFEGGRS